MMRPGTPIDPQDLPRSRYEQSEESEARPIARITFGLLLTNVFLLVKDMLFGKTPDAKALESEPEAARAFVPDSQWFSLLLYGNATINGIPPALG